VRFFPSFLCNVGVYAVFLKGIRGRCTRTRGDNSLYTNASFGFYDTDCKTGKPRYVFGAAAGAHPVATSFVVPVDAGVAAVLDVPAASLSNPNLLTAKTNWAKVERLKPAVSA
jgi:hypothetical protein